jgi:integrase
MAKQRKRGIKGAGSVYQRKSDGRWVGSFIVEETGKRKSIYASTEKEAWQKLQQALQEQKQGTLATSPKQKLSTFLTQWLEEVHRPPAIRPTTYQRYLDVSRKHILPALGHFELQKVTPQRIQTFYSTKLKEGQSTSSVHIMHSLLSKAFDTAVKWRLISSNPCKGTTIPHEVKREAQSLTEEQARHLLEAARDHDLEVFVVTALSTGMRIGELLALRWSDIDMEQGMVNVHRTVTYLRGHFIEGEPKTKSGKRKILIPAEACAILQKHRQQQQARREQTGVKWQDLDLVFCTRSGGFLHAGVQEHRLYRLLEQVQLPRMHVHDLRHSAATLLGAMGVNPKVIQEILGHSSLKITLEIYSHVLPSMQQDARDKMQRFFQSPPEQQDNKAQKEEGDEEENKG